MVVVVVDMGVGKSEKSSVENATLLRCRMGKRHCGVSRLLAFVWNQCDISGHIPVADLAMIADPTDVVAFATLRFLCRQRRFGWNASIDHTSTAISSNLKFKARRLLNTRSLCGLNLYHVSRYLGGFDTIRGLAGRTIENFNRAISTTLHA